MKPIFQISSATDSRPQEPVLAIKIGERHVGFAISTLNADQLYHLSFYTAEDMDGATLKDIIKNNRELDRPFTKVLISYDHPQSLVLPAGNYDADDATKMLAEIYGVNGLAVTVKETVQDWQLENAYAVPTDTRDVIINHFRSVKYQHYYSIGIRAVDLAVAETLIRVDFRTDEFSLILIHQNKLLLAQTYFYSVPADVIYTLLNVCRQHGLSQEGVKLELSGLIEKDSALYRDIYQYFLQIGFKEPSWSIPATDGQEYPAHFFTTFNELALCES